MTDSPPADQHSPDHSTCHWCAQPITWDDWCYVHDENGWADCGTRIFGSDLPIPDIEGINILINPAIVQDDKYVNRTAEPVEWYQEGGPKWEARS